MTFRCQLTAFCCLIAISICGSSLADIALPPELQPEPPKPSPDAKASVSSDFVVKYDKNVPTRIVIPTQLMAKADSSSEKTSAFSPGRNVVAGFAMSAAVVGLFFVIRRGGSRSITTASLLVAVLATGALSVAWGNAAVPEQEFTPTLLNVEKKAMPQVQVEFSKKAKAITLVIGKDFPLPATQDGAAIDIDKAAPN